MEEKTELQPYSVLMSVYSGENADFLKVTVAPQNVLIQDLHFAKMNI